MYVGLLESYKTALFYRETNGMSFIVKYGLNLQLMLLKIYNTTNVVVQYYKGS